MKKIAPLFLALTLTINLNAQSNSENKSLLDRFFPDYNSFSLLNLNMSLNTEFPTTITKGGIGGSMEIGLNLSRFFAKKMLISPYVGMNILSCKNYQDNFIQQLISDYSALPQEYWDLHDNISFLSNEERGKLYSYEQAAEEFNHIASNNITSKIGFYYGLAIKVPVKYIPLVKFYRSYLNISGKKDVQPVGWITYSPSSQDPYTDLAGEININGYGCEIDLFTGWFADSDDFNANIRLAQISLYVERYSLESLEIGSNEELSLLQINSKKMPLKSFLKADETLTDKYSSELRFGIKLGISIL